MNSQAYNEFKNRWPRSYKMERRIFFAWASVAAVSVIATIGVSIWSWLLVVETFGMDEVMRLNKMGWSVRMAEIDPALPWLTPAMAVVTFVLVAKAMNKSC